MNVMKMTTEEESKVKALVRTGALLVVEIGRAIKNGPAGTPAKYGRLDSAVDDFMSAVFGMREDR